MRVSVRRHVMAAALIAACLAVSGCGANKAAVVTSSWPRATGERVVPRPPIPPRWPLTGIQAQAGSSVGRRAISVKIENSPSARPQTGLQSADVVYECLAEGGVTRFNAIFHSTFPPLVGPVRSARLSDIHIVPQYNALFVFSGSSTFVGGRIRRAKLPNLSEDAGVTRPFERVDFRAAPHNLYLYPDRVYGTAAERKMSPKGAPRAFRFERRSAETTVQISEISIPFSPANRVRWTWSAVSRTYLRENNGVTHLEASTEKPLSATNVVVMWARTVSTGHTDVIGSETLDIDLSGKNRVSIFRGGRRYDGTWQGSKTAPPTFVAADGTPLRLAPGNTWFQVIPTNVNISLK